MNTMLVKYIKTFCKHQNESVMSRVDSMTETEGGETYLGATTIVKLEKCRCK